MRLRILTLLVTAIAGLGASALADERYTVQRGDTLLDLALEFYGSTSGWRLIYRANRDRVFDGGDLVAVGTVLLIPDAPQGANFGAGWQSDRDQADGSDDRDSRISMATPTTLLLDNGQAFIGTIVGSSANSIFIRRGVRTFKIAMARVNEARVDSRNGGVIAGQLLDWKNGIFDLRADNYRLTVRGGEIISTSLLGRAGSSDAPAYAISTRDVGIAETPIIRLQNGKQIAGYVTRFDQRFVNVRRGTRGSNRIRLTDIAEVQISASDGTTVAGALVDWDDGIYRLQSGTRTVIARESIVPTEPTSTAVADAQDEAVEEILAEVEPSPEPVKAETAVALLDDDNQPEIRVRSQAPPGPANERPEPSQQTSVGVRNQPFVRSTSTAPAESSTTPPSTVTAASDGNADESGLVGDLIPVRELVPEEGEAITVAVTSSPTSEGSGALRFEIGLSRAPSERLVIVYASVDGTATSGVDYEKASGVEVFEPGQRSLYVDIPLIDDGEVEGDETVHLFISPDPSRAKVEKRSVVGVVHDNDS